MNGNDDLLQEDSLDGVERALLEGESARLGSDEAVASPAAARLVVDRFRAHERQRRVLVTAGSALALAAAAALVVGLSRSSGEVASSPQVPQRSHTSALVLESGHVSLASALTVLPGQPIVAETLAELAPSTCLRAGSQVRLCSKGGAKLKLPAQGAAWDIELESGVVTAELEDMPAGFSLRTLHGSATVVGTVFSMERSAGFTTVIVERGRVRVKNARSGEEALIWVGQQARLGEALEVSGLGHEQVEAPLSAVQEGVPAPGATEPHGAAPPTASKGKAAADLLEEARQQRGSRHYAQAAQLYRKLVTQHPESAEARAALVSLGQLELGQLGQPEAALRSFQAYLARPGQLRQEAEHGAIQALQRLGRKAEERRAIEGFLARYPKSTQAGPLSERLKQL